MNLSSGVILDSSYQIIEELGSGAMGSVYSALDLNLNRKVAIKVLCLSGAEPADQLARFEREGRILSKIQHDNIIKVYKFGYYVSGVQELKIPYLVMELLEGETLRELLSRRLTIGGIEALSIAISIAQAMIEAHLAGIIHRDLKPQNIFMGQATDKPILKVLDFGLCKEVKDNEHLTMTGYLLGSTHYMSPECCKGHTATPESDIYSLGIILYELLTGMVPYNSDNPIGILYKHIHEPTPSLSRNFPHFPNAAQFDKILEKCLAKAPQERYRSMEELSADLLKLQTKLEAEGAAPGDKLIPEIVSSRSASLPKNTILAASSLIILLLLLAGIFSFVQRLNHNVVGISSSAAPLTLSQLKRLAEKEKDIELTQQSIDYAVAEVDKWLANHNKAARMDPSNFDALDLKAEWLYQSKRSADCSKAEQIWRQILDEVKGKDDLRELSVRTNLTKYYVAKEMNCQGISVSRPIYDIWRQHKPIDSNCSRAAYNGLLSSMEFHSAEENIPICRKIREISESLFGTYSGMHLHDIFCLIDNLKACKKYDEAQRLSDRAIEIAKKCYAVPLALANAFENRAAICMDLQQFKVAYQLLLDAESALNASSSIKAEEKWKVQQFGLPEQKEGLPDLQRIKFAQGQCLLKLKRLEPALTSLRMSESLAATLRPFWHIRALAALAATYADNSFDNDLHRICRQLDSLGSDALLKKVCDQADILCRREHEKAAQILLLAMLQCQPDRKSETEIESLAKLGDIYMLNHDFRAAVKCYDRAAVIASDISTMSTARIVVLLKKTECLEKLDLFAQAYDTQNLCLDLAHRANEPLLEGFCLCYQGKYLERQSHWAEALEKYGRSLSLMESTDWQHAKAIPRLADSGLNCVLQDQMREARCLLKLGDRVQAQSKLNSATTLIKKFPVLAKLNMEYGNILSAIRNMNEAIRQKKSG